MDTQNISIKNASINFNSDDNGSIANKPFLQGLPHWSPASTVNAEKEIRDTITKETYEESVSKQNAMNVVNTETDSHNKKLEVQQNFCPSCRILQVIM